MLTKKRFSAGFTFPEIAISLGIFAILVGYITINLMTVHRDTSVRTAMETFISDLRTQQTKAMAGDTETRATPDSYGVAIGATSYTLFHGTTYNPADSSNFTVNLEGSIQFAAPGLVLVFNKVDGSVANFASIAHSITLQDTASSEYRTLTFNTYGVVTQVTGQ